MSFCTCACSADWARSDLVGPDEPRYAAIARAMAETHDWVTPRLWGTPWFEKPVLYYWMAGAAMRIFGVSEFAARLPSALAALLAVLAVGWTALRSYGLGAAWYSLLMLPTSVAMIGFSRAASPDMLFAGLLTAAMAVACEMLQKPRPGPVLRVAFGFFLGAAVLAKGPAAVILAGGATLLWAALSRNWRAPFRFLHPLVILVFCATALPWYVLCALRNPDFLRVFIWQHNFERYLTPIFEHRQPFWFFGPILLLGILPWLPLTITSINGAIRECRTKTVTTSPGLFIACWSVFTLVFFSASQSKLPGYILPAFPPAVLIIARFLARQIEQKTGGLSLALVASGVIFPLLLGIERLRPSVAFGQELITDPNFLRHLLDGFLVALAGALAVISLIAYRKWKAAVCAVGCSIALIVLIANHRIMPELDNLVSARPAATDLIRRLHAKPGEVGVYQVPRAFGYGLNYYFARELPEWAPNQPAPVYLFVGSAALTQRDRFRQLADPKATPFLPVSGDGKVYMRASR